MDPDRITNTSDKPRPKRTIVVRNHVPEIHISAATTKKNKIFNAENAAGAFMCLIIVGVFGFLFWQLEQTGNSKPYIPTAEELQEEAARREAYEARMQPQWEIIETYGDYGGTLRTACIADGVRIYLWDSGDAGGMNFRTDEECVKP